MIFAIHPHNNGFENFCGTLTKIEVNHLKKGVAAIETSVGLK